MDNTTRSHHGTTFYVSRLGDNTDGRSWSSAYRTIQAALGAIPDANGGHRIIIRPDTYLEGNLHPAHAGAPGAYNVLDVDWDGSLGSGASGYAVVDASDPERGMQSVDWWGFPRCTPEHSGVDWDRWKLRHIYATGGDGGLFWDLPFKIAPFSIIVEDSVGIGRAFGGGVGHVLPRPEEPIVFRRCTLWSLDWWGDTAGAYVRAENTEPPSKPDVFFESCTLVGPQCALKSGNPGFSSYSYVSLDRCTLIVLNFSQPHGTPTDGIIQSVIDGKYLRVDMRDSSLMGYKVFGVRHHPETEKDIRYNVSGCVRAYVQYQQAVPDGVQPLGHWPVDLFESIKPPSPDVCPNAAFPRPQFGKSELVQKDMCELTPIMWHGRLCHLMSVRPGSGGRIEDYRLELWDAESGEQLARFAVGHSLASAIVHGDTLFVFASRFGDNTWNDVTLFESSDLVNWKQSVVIEQDKGEHLFNTSVCESPNGFVLAYETNDPAYPAFTVKYAMSKDLRTWVKQPDAVFGTDRYAACPCIRYANGWYYQMYLEHPDRRWWFETYIARSRDLRTWEQSSMNPVIRPSELDDGINASDPEIIEHNGRTWLYYAVGDQRTWMNIKRIPFDGNLATFFESWFTAPAVPEHGTLSAERTRAVERRKWFGDAKFGMFIHWGLYSVRAKNDAGPYVSWSMSDENIPRDEYAKYADVFNPQKFDATKWMEIAKRTGMKYVVFTSKHHEGFSMFDSELSDFTSVKKAAKRDICREIVEAARSVGLRVGFYYSLLDWHHPDFDADLAKYVSGFAHRQVAELCTNYGPIDVVWFDGEWDYPTDTWRVNDLVRMIRQLQPNAVINDRLGKDERGKNRLADFFTREQMDEIGKHADFESDRRPWEACMTIGRSWGFRHDDAPFKSADELIRALVDIVSRNGNLLLNVGPTPDGEIPQHLVDRLDGIGEWMEKNGESIYGTIGTRIDGHPATMNGNMLYIHIVDPETHDISLETVQNEVHRAWLLATGDNVAYDATAKRMILPEVDSSQPVTTVAVELDDRLRNV